MAKIKVIKSEEIALPNPEKERRLGIREQDINRLKRLLTYQAPKLSAIRTWYSILFSVGGSTAVTIFPLWITIKKFSFIITIYFLVTISCFIIGGILVYVNKQLTKGEKDKNNLILEDIKEIERSFGISSENNPQG